MGFGIPKLGSKEGGEEKNILGMDSDQVEEFAKKGAKLAEGIIKDLAKKKEMRDRVVRRISQELENGGEGFGQPQDEEFAKLEESLSEGRISQDAYEEGKMYLELKEGKDADINKQIVGLEELKEAGNITEEEFEEARADLEKLRKK